MTIKIIISDTVGIKVKGVINDAAGTPQSFDFVLTCKRLDTDQIQTKIKSEADASLTDFLCDVTQNWSGVRDADDTPLMYSDANLRQLCKIPGISILAYRTYMTEVGAKEKN